MMDVDDVLAAADETERKLHPHLVDVGGGYLVSERTAAMIVGEVTPNG